MDIGSILVKAAAATVASVSLVGSAAAYDGGPSALESRAPQAAAQPRPQVFVASTGSDQANCSRVSPCRSFDHAYRVARSGQVVEVAGGLYEVQVVGVDSSKSSSEDVVFQPASGATVGLGNLEVRGSHVTFVGLAVDFWSASGSDVTMRTIDGGSFYSSGSDVFVEGGDYGPYEPPCATGAQYPEHDNPTVNGGSRVVIRGAVFHDMTNRNCSASHMDCLQVAAVNGLVIEGNRFRGCFSNGLILTGDFGAMNNITVQNNWFGPTLVGNPSLNWNPTRDCPGAVVRYNTFVGSGVRFECSQDRSAQLYGNILPGLEGWLCQAWRAVQHHNIADTGQATSACGAGSFVVRDGSIDFVDREGGDYHLARGSEAIGRGEVALLRGDIDGEARPLRSRADAGADQREPAVLLLEGRVGMVALGMRRDVVETFYGARPLHAVPGASPRVRFASYARAGGRLFVTYDGDPVVGVSTTSPYYTTPTGVGVGAQIEGTPLGHLPWNACSKAHRRSLGRNTLDVRPKGGKGGKTIAQIAMMRRAYAAC